MEQILFRAKRLDNGAWVEGFYSNLFNEPTNAEETAITFQVFEGADMSYPYPTVNTVHAIVDEKTVCQFTGAIDCSGKQIFENDIIFNEDRMQHQVVFYDEERFCFFCKYVGCEETVSLCNSIGNANYKVGNIFDNADLVSF